jgi:hypothetical protein
LGGVDQWALFKDDGSRKMPGGDTKMDGGVVGTGFGGRSPSSDTDGRVDNTFGTAATTASNNIETTNNVAASTPNTDDGIAVALIVALVVVGVVCLLVGIAVAAFVVLRSRSSSSSSSSIAANPVYNPSTATTDYTVPGAPAQLYGGAVVPSNYGNRVFCHDLLFSTKAFCNHIHVLY